MNKTQILKKYAIDEDKTKNPNFGKPVKDINSVRNGKMEVENYISLKVTNFLENRGFKCNVNVNNNEVFVVAEKKLNSKDRQERYNEAKEIEKFISQKLPRKVTTKNFILKRDNSGVRTTTVYGNPVASWDFYYDVIDNRQFI